MVRRTLMTHPQVSCRAEVLDSRPDFRELTKEWDVTTEALLALRARDPIGFLDRYVFSSRDAVEVVGCKLFYFHADVADPGEPWRWLNDQADLRVIHLQRRNHLRRLLSHRTAFATGEWMRMRDTAAPTVPMVEITLEDFLADMRDVEATRDRAVARLARREMMQISYEDLTADFAGSMGRVQEFLGVRPMALVSDTLQQNAQALAERISNFAALRAGLAGTPYAWMLDD